MRKYNVSIAIIALFVLTGCTHTPEPLNLAACDLEVKFAAPANSTFQCGSPITFVLHVLNRSEVAPVCGQLGGLFKVYSGCRSSCQNILGSIFLSPLLRLWVSGQGA